METSKDHFIGDFNFEVGNFEAVKPKEWENLVLDRRNMRKNENSGRKKILLFYFLVI